MDTRDYLSPDEAEQLRQDLEEARKALHRALAKLEKARAFALKEPPMDGGSSVWMGGWEDAQQELLAILDGEELSNG